jgi:Uma2 family endonuclease
MELGDVDMAMLTELTPMETAADLASRFGVMPLRRLRLNTSGWQATEEDVIALNDRENHLCELLDGILVEKTVGVYESYLALQIAFLLTDYVRQYDLGVVLGTDGMMRLWPGRVRIPDASFISWDRLLNKQVPRIPMIESGPNLAVEVISPSNTDREMREKLADYFASNVLLVWYIYPTKREVHVYTTPEKVTVLNVDETLDGGSVLPGFRLELLKLLDCNQPTA